MAFLGSALSSTLVYIWSRRNPDALLNFLGLITFRAPFLPWVLMGFSLVLHGHLPKDELFGTVIGHSRSSFIPQSQITDKNTELTDGNSLVLF